MLELFKPVTWFPPMWAFACGVISSGATWSGAGARIAIGVLVAGPLVCAASQAVNDWFDREVDAVNEPLRPIPSGRIPGRWGLWLAVLWTAVSAGFGLLLGPWGFGATLLALVLAWAYSAPPIRLKQNGWLGNGAVGLSYEGLAWVTGAAVAAGAGVSGRILLVAFLYSVGAHGIMTLNDYKSRHGDLALGVGSLPARLGPANAARVACAFMLVAQVLVVGFLAAWGHPVAAASVLLLGVIQAVMMKRFLADPDGRALWLSAFGVPFYVSGMMVAAFALRSGAQP